MIIDQTLAMKQTCVQLNVFQINDNPFDNSMKLLYANPFKEASTSLTIIAAPHDNMQVGDIMEIYKLVSQMTNSWSWSWVDQTT